MECMSYLKRGVKKRITVRDIKEDYEIIITYISPSRSQEKILVLIYLSQVPKTRSIPEHTLQ